MSRSLSTSEKLVGRISPPSGGTGKTSTEKEGGGEELGAEAQRGPLKVMYTEWLAPRR